MEEGFRSWSSGALSWSLGADFETETEKKWGRQIILPDWVIGLCANSSRLTVNDELCPCFSFDPCVENREKGNGEEKNTRERERERF